MSVDSIKNTLMVALGVCLVSAVLVSSSVVTLKPTQVENARLDKLKNILMAADLYTTPETIESTYKERIKPKVITLNNGQIIPEDELPQLLSYENFDIKKVSSDPAHSAAMDAQKDVAGIRRLPKEMLIYQVRNGDVVEKYILPVYGQGLWSTLYGFLALDSDLKTIRGITFYEHGETPGLGGEVDNPRWKAQWKGKMAYDDNMKILIEVLKGQVDPTSPQAGHQIDGLGGSTITTRGVHNLVRFWLGENGYKPVLSNIGKEVAS
jgi:Na+-transporting NADH:ubiquinone oxidoreductase subunit C